MHTEQKVWSNLSLRQQNYLILSDIYWIFRNNMVIFGPCPLVGAPFLCGPLFGRTCWTCLNPPLVDENCRILVVVVVFVTKINLHHSLWYMISVMPTYVYHPRYRTLPLSLGRYSFPTPLREGGWVGLSGWLHIKMVYPWMVTHLSTNCACCRVTLLLWPSLAFSAFTLLVGHQEEHPVC